MTLSIIIPLAAVAFAAAFVQGALGIGFALIVAPVVGMLRPDLLPVTLLLLMLPLNFQVAWRERAHIDRSGAGWITLGRFAGTFVGMWLLMLLSPHQLGIAAGAFTVIAAVIALLAPPFTLTRPAALAVGVVTGITENSTGIGGPPRALLYQHKPGPVLRSTVAVCFFVGEGISLIVLALAGKITRDQVWAALMVAPVVILGAALSRAVHSRISPAPCDCRR